MGLFLTIILLFAELFEVYIQRADTLLGVLQKLYHYYHKSVFVFFLIQPGFYTLLGIVIFTNLLNVSMVLLVAIKLLDMFYKIELIQQVFLKQKVSLEIAQLLEWKIPKYFLLSGVALYPPLLYYALS
ncbi:MAG: hypothetical protein RLZZ428_697 [Pseudomonadota bacterium]